MTKKDFEELARILAEHQAARALCESIARFYLRSNSRFKPEKFLGRIEELKT